MGISVKNEQVEADIRRLAAYEETGVTEAIGLAVRKRLEHIEMDVDRRRERTDRLLAFIRSIPKDPDTSPDHDWLYDENGMPK